MFTRRLRKLNPPQHQSIFLYLIGINVGFHSFLKSSVIFQRNVLFSTTSSNFFNSNISSSSIIKLDLLKKKIKQKLIIDTLFGIHFKIYFLFQNTLLIFIGVLLFWQDSANRNRVWQICAEHGGRILLVYLAVEASVLRSLLVIP